MKVIIAMWVDATKTVWLWKDGFLTDTRKTFAELDFEDVNKWLLDGDGFKVGLRREKGDEEE